MQNPFDQLAEDDTIDLYTLKVLHFARKNESM